MHIGHLGHVVKERNDIFDRGVDDTGCLATCGLFSVTAALYAVFTESKPFCRNTESSLLVYISWSNVPCPKRMLLWDEIERERDGGEKHAVEGNAAPAALKEELTSIDSSARPETQAGGEDDHQFEIQLHAGTRKDDVSQREEGGGRAEDAIRPYIEQCPDSIEQCVTSAPTSDEERASRSPVSTTMTACAPDQREQEGQGDTETQSTSRVAHIASCSKSSSDMLPPSMVCWAPAKTTVRAEQIRIEGVCAADDTPDSRVNGIPPLPEWRLLFSRSRVKQSSPREGVSIKSESRARSLALFNTISRVCHLPALHAASSR